MATTEDFSGSYRSDDEFSKSDLAVAELRTAFRVAGLKIPDIAADNTPNEGPMLNTVEIFNFAWPDARRLAHLVLLGLQNGPEEAQPQQPIEPLFGRVVAKNSAN
jgi:hypothetical protein